MSSAVTHTGLSVRLRLSAGPSGMAAGVWSSGPRRRGPVVREVFRQPFLVQKRTFEQRDVKQPCQAV